MKTTNTLFILFLSLFFSNALIAQTVELYPFGDMDQWVVREIKESGIIGGNTVTIYAIGPTDTIRENKPYVYGKKGCPWTVSNAYAVVAGVKKGSCSVYPEKRGNGYDRETLHCLVSAAAGRLLAPAQARRKPNMQLRRLGSRLRR